MAIISFWNNGTDETGKSSAIAAISTFLGANHNYKILVLNTKYNDFFYQDCFWQEDKSAKESYTSMEEGVRGLSRAVLSNKISPEIIPNYTKIVFNDNRLEILMDTNILREEYDMHKNIFIEIIKMANKFYDLVFVDIDSKLEENIQDSLLDASDLIVSCIPQKIRTINSYIKAIKEKSLLKEKPLLTIVGRYDLNSKYNQKNISKYIKQKNQVAVIPYNTTFMEACNEGRVADFFMKYLNVNINKKDKNAEFILGVSNTSEKIIYKLQELQMRM